MISYKLYFNGFWSGFHDRTNAVNDLFFLNVMKNVYNTNIEVTYNINAADILIENTQIVKSQIDFKQWIHTYLFSGESYLHSDYHKYSCVLFGNRNHKNIINVPLYVPYYICSFDESYITENKKNIIRNVPENEILVIVSNPGGHIRNQFMEELDKHFKVTYAGNYKNNKPIIQHYYNSDNFREYVSKFKFILSMENSENDTYITEKITHGLLGGSIPIYWGSKRVTDYFNSERFLEIKESSDFEQTINRMKNMRNDEWLRRVNLKPFTDFGSKYTVNTIANHIKNLLFVNPFPKLTQLLMICNNEYEPERYGKLLKMCDNLKLKDYNYKFICPTYKHTITDDIMSKYVTTDRIYRLRTIPIRKSEVSLYLNFKSVWEYIIKTYKDGTFLILEADAFVLPEIRNFNTCLNKLEGKEWSGINISSDGGSTVSFNKKDSYVEYLGYRDGLSNNEKNTLEENSIEDLSTPDDKDVRFMRKYHTRCTDSQLWSYNGCCQMLDIFNNIQICDIPLDYYITETLEKNMNIKYYWSDETYFDQLSNRGLEKSTIQTDIK